MVYYSDSLHLSRPGQGCQRAARDRGRHRRGQGPDGRGGTIWHRLACQPWLRRLVGVKSISDSFRLEVIKGRQAGRQAGWQTGRQAGSAYVGSVEKNLPSATLPSTFPPPPLENQGFVNAKQAGKMSLFS